MTDGDLTGVMDDMMALFGIFQREKKEREREQAVMDALVVIRDHLHAVLTPVVHKRGLTMGPRYKPREAPIGLDMRTKGDIARMFLTTGTGNRLFATGSMRAAIEDPSLADTIRRMTDDVVRALKMAFPRMNADASHTSVCVGAFWDGMETAVVGVVLQHPDDVPSAADPKSEEVRARFEPLDEAPILPPPPRTAAKRTREADDRKKNTPVCKKHKK